MRVIEEGVDGVALCCTDEGVASEVMTDLVGAVTRGDAVLVHAGVALTRVP